ncbi:MAG: isochorismate synthase [Bacteroidota bacterium]
MPTLITTDPRQRLARRVTRAMPHGDGVVRAEAPWPDAPDPLDWLAAHAGEQTAYWSGRDDETVRAAIGIAHEITGPDALRQLAEAAPALPEGATYLGGLRFDGTTPTEREWAGFGAGRFILPRVEMVVRDGEATLAVNAVSRDSHEAVRSALDRIVLDPTPMPRALDYPVARVDRPDREGWRGAVESALAAMERGEMRKVVLARRATYRFEDALDPTALLHRLTEAAPTAFHVLLSDGAGRQFLAATPERLVRVTGREAWTEAVAGTRRRGAGADARAFHDELAGSEKDRREHAFVRDFITEALAPFASVVCVERPLQIEAARVRHLKTPLRATLREGVAPLDVVEALHPTPAVAGTPTPAALATIHRLEGFDRGLYAGPIGWVSRDAAEFAVGIRSGLLCGTDLALYAGAGLVPGSVAEAEWNETEAKLGAFADALGLEG